MKELNHERGKYILTFFLVLLIILIVKGLFNYYEEMEEFIDIFLFIFYILWNLLFSFYYLRLIWGEQEISGENILMLPILQKIGLFVNYSSSENMKRKLLYTSFPVIFSSVVCISLCSFEDLYKYYNLLLFIPILITIFCLGSYWIREWLKSSNK